jgi:post-segregation antitoxin (ccd killing protein)
MPVNRRAKRMTQNAEEYAANRRINVYLGHDLMLRLHAHGDAVNVSEVCQAALTAHLDALDAKEKARAALRNPWWLRP